MLEPVQLRASCLVARAYACASGFDRIGRSFSADLTRGFALDIETGKAPSGLYEYWIAEQEARLERLSA